MRPANSTAASTLSTTSLVTQGWPMASMASLKPWRSSRLADGLRAGAQQAHAVLLQDALLVEVHGQVQPGLAAQGGQDGVGPLLGDDLLHAGQVQRLDIHVVGDVLVGHDGGGVGVDQHHLHALPP